MSRTAAGIVHPGIDVRAEPQPRAAPETVIANVVETELLAAILALRLPADELHLGVHAARKHMRRARAALWLAKRSLEPAADTLDRRIERVCRSLSALRDAQALVEALQRLGDDAPSWLSDAMACATRRRDDTLRRELKRDPGFQRRVLRLRKAAACVPTLNWHLLGPVDIARALRRSRRRVQTAFHHASLHRGDDVAWHRLRRRLRRLRLQTAMLRGASPEVIDAAATNDDLARTLGHAQDDALLRAHCGPGSPFPRQQQHELAAIAARRLDTARQRAATAFIRK